MSYQKMSFPLLFDFINIPNQRLFLSKLDFERLVFPKYCTVLYLKFESCLALASWQNWMRLCGSSRSLGSGEYKLTVKSPSHSSCPPSFTIEYHESRVDDSQGSDIPEATDSAAELSVVHDEAAARRPPFAWSRQPNGFSTICKTSR